MRHNPVCFHRTWTRLNTHHQLFSILILFFGAASAALSGWRAKAGFRVDHECYDAVCLGESYRGQFGIPIFGWRRLCRITPPRNSSRQSWWPIYCRPARRKRDDRGLAVHSDGAFGFHHCADRVHSRKAFSGLEQFFFRIHSVRPGRSWSPSPSDMLPRAESHDP
jgi:hypothetical protein